MSEMTESPIDTSLLNKKIITPSPIRGVCVYCGSGKGVNHAYTIAARRLGKALADDGIRLVYGGGSLGLMGEVARAALGAGGKVTGIIPEFLVAREMMLKDVDDLIVVKNMHMGGIGTLEELVEQLTWSQLGRHSKPIVIANIEGFWDPFLNLLAHMKCETFIRSGLDVHFAVVDKVEDILPTILSMAEPESPQVDEAVVTKF